MSSPSGYYHQMEKACFKSISNQFTADGNFPKKKQLKLEKTVNKNSEGKEISITRIATEASSYDRNIAIAHLFDTILYIQRMVAFTNETEPKYEAIAIENNNSPSKDVAIKILDPAKTEIVRNAEYEINDVSCCNILRVWTDEELITITEGEDTEITYAPICGQNLKSASEQNDGSS